MGFSSLRSRGVAPLRLLLLLFLCGGIAAFFLSGGRRFLSFDELVAHKGALIAWADSHPVLAPAAADFFA